MLGRTLSVDIVENCTVEYFRSFHQSINVTWQYGLCNYAWLINWLKVSSVQPHLAILYDTNTAIGYCFFSLKRNRILALSWNSAYLNQTGCSDVDQIWVENNGLFCASEHQEVFFYLIKNTLLDKYAVDEFIISLASQALDKYNENHYFSMESKELHLSYTKDLCNINSIEDVLKRLSKNSRAQLRRALRQTISKYGAIKVVTHNQLDKTLTDFQAMAELHKKKWGDSEHGSGFNNTKFVSFHKAMLDTPNKAILLKIEAENKTLGHAYFITEDKTAYFYCSGIDNDVGLEKFKVGYILHLYCMLYFAQNGYAIYDFLAGDYRYKKSLSDNTYEMYSYRFVKSGGFFQKLLKIKNLLKSFVAKP